MYIYMKDTILKEMENKKLKTLWKITKTKKTNRQVFN